jgi:hypothetical protein
MNIKEKIQQVRLEIQKLNLKKTGYNPIAGFYYYELSDFVPAVNKLFSELKLYEVFLIDDDKAYLKVFDLEDETKVETF